MLGLLWDLYKSTYLIKWQLKDIIIIVIIINSNS